MEKLDFYEQEKERVGFLIKQYIPIPIAKDWYKINDNVICQFLSENNLFDRFKFEDKLLEFNLITFSNASLKLGITFESMISLLKKMLDRDIFIKSKVDIEFQLISKDLLDYIFVKYKNGKNCRTRNSKLVEIQKNIEKDLKCSIIPEYCDINKHLLAEYFDIIKLKPVSQKYVVNLIGTKPSHLRFDSISCNTYKEFKSIIGLDYKYI